MGVFKIITTLIITLFSPSPALDDPCASTFCCSLCDDRGMGCSDCGRDTGSCEGTVLSCESGCYNGGYACGSTSQPWTGGCCS